MTQVGRPYGGVPTRWTNLLTIMDDLRLARWSLGPTGTIQCGLLQFGPFNYLHITTIPIFLVFTFLVLCWELLRPISSCVRDVGDVFACYRSYVLYLELVVTTFTYDELRDVFENVNP